MEKEELNLIRQQTQPKELSGTHPLRILQDSSEAQLILILSLTIVTLLSITMIICIASSKKKKSKKNQIQSIRNIGNTIPIQVQKPRKFVPDPLKFATSSLRSCSNEPSCNKKETDETPKKRTSNPPEDPAEIFYTVTLGQEESMIQIGKAEEFKSPKQNSKNNKKKVENSGESSKQGARSVKNASRREGLSIHKSKSSIYSVGLKEILRPPPSQKVDVKVLDEALYNETESSVLAESKSKLKNYNLKASLKGESSSKGAGILGAGRHGKRSEWGGGSARNLRNVGSHQSGLRKAGFGHNKNTASVAVLK